MLSSCVAELDKATELNNDSGLRTITKELNKTFRHKLSAPRPIKGTLNKRAIPLLITL